MLRASLAICPRSSENRRRPMRGRPKTTWTHPVLVQHQEERARNLQDRIADAITDFAGSMPFVYLHVIWFTLWIAFRVEKFPFGFLTMLVSLEAIFLSTFVMISQNRADEKRAALAEHQWQIVRSEERQNEELLSLSRQILDLTKQIHSLTTGSKQASTEAPT
jgi:uncharacterized membrane protein